MSQFSSLDGELFLVRRLGQHGHRVFTGDTAPNERRARMRRAILEAGLDCTIVGKNRSGKPETFAALFERLYSEPLA